MKEFQLTLVPDDLVDEMRMRQKTNSKEKL